MKRVKKFLSRLFRQSKNRFEYALIYHKVSRRLGYARSQNRQLRLENEFLREMAADLRRRIIENAPSVTIEAVDTEPVKPYIKAV